MVLNAKRSENARFFLTDRYLSLSSKFRGLLEATKFTQIKMKGAEMDEGRKLRVEVRVRVPSTGGACFYSCGPVYGFDAACRFPRKFAITL